MEMTGFLGYGITSKMLFYAVSDPSRHFANRIYTPYLLSEQLKAESVSCSDDVQWRERYQLRYYGILPCTEEK